MYASVKINYLDREVWVDYDFDKAEDDVNLGARVRVLKVEYNRRNITALVDANKVEDAVMEEFHEG
jgi:hypothetical protein